MEEKISMLNCLIDTCLQNLYKTINYAEDNELTNTQQFIDFEDILNKMSNKVHNK